MQDFNFDPGRNSRGDAAIYALLLLLALIFSPIIPAMVVSVLDAIVRGIFG